MEDQFLHECLPRLPEQLFGEILQYLDADHIFLLLQVPQLRQTVIDEIYTKEVHFALSPTRRPHICNGRSDLVDITSLTECDDFLEENPDINPKTVAVITHGDFSSLRTFLQKHAKRLAAIPCVEILVESYSLASYEMDFVLSRPNLTKLQIGGITMEHCGSSLEENLLNCTSLDQLVILGHQINNWSRVIFPPSITVLDISWNLHTDITTMVFPPRLNELFLNRSGISDSILKSLTFPSSLQTLQLTHNMLEHLDVSCLPRTIETLDLSSNIIESISGQWPPYLKTILLHGNSLHDHSFAHMGQWPQNLQTLRVDVNKLFSFGALKGLPDDLHYLDVSHNNFNRYEILDNHGSTFEFPRNLKTLFLTGNDRLKYDDQHRRIRFPPTLTKLNMDGCNITSLEHFHFPSSLISLSVSGNRISDICSYIGHGVDWTQLSRLVKLELVYNRINSVAHWVPPRNLRTLNLSENSFTELRRAQTPLFDGVEIQLTTLILDDNQITHLDSVRFPPQLRTISLENNLITASLDLAPFSSIQEVFLKGNTLTGVYFSYSSTESKVKKLDLTQNEILRKSKTKEQVAAFYELLETGFGKAVCRPKFNLNSVHIF